MRKVVLLGNPDTKRTDYFRQGKAMGKFSGDRIVFKN